MYLSKSKSKKKASKRKYLVIFGLGAQGMLMSDRVCVKIYHFDNKNLFDFMEYLLTFAVSTLH